MKISYYFHSCLDDEQKTVKPNALLLAGQYRSRCLNGSRVRRRQPATKTGGQLCNYCSPESARTLQSSLGLSEFC